MVLSGGGLSPLTKAGDLEDRSHRSLLAGDGDPGWLIPFVVFLAPVFPTSGAEENSGSFLWFSFSKRSTDSSLFPKSAIGPHNAHLFLVSLQSRFD